MAVGETKFSSRGQAVKRFTNNPIPRGVYPLELLGDGMEVKVSKDNPENSIPRVGVRFAAQGTGKDGGKDRLMFHDFFLSLKPGKDGVAMPFRGGGLVEFARAQGDELENIDLLEKTIEVDGAPLKVKYLDPAQVMEYLESKVGVVTEGKVTIEADRDESKGPNGKFPINEDHPGRNKLDNWKLDEALLQGDGEEEPEEEAPRKPVASTAKKPLPKKGK